MRDTLSRFRRRIGADRDPRPPLQMPAGPVRGGLSASRPTCRARRPRCRRDPGRGPDGGPGADYTRGLTALPRGAGGTRDRVLGTADGGRVDGEHREARLSSGDKLSYDLLIGIPIHRVPEVVESSGLAVEGWVPVDKTNLKTRFPNVYAVGDVAGLPMAKAGVFAESAARTVAADIAAHLHGPSPRCPTRAPGTATSSSAAAESRWSRRTSSAVRSRGRGWSGLPRSLRRTNGRLRRSAASAGSAVTQPRTRHAER